MACVYPAGTTGGSLHGGTLFDGEAQNGFGLEFGRQLAGGCNVAWALHPEEGGWGHEFEGGFVSWRDLVDLHARASPTGKASTFQVCVPGSQRASYPMPLGLANSLELPCVRKPHLNAGDVLFFAGVAHGTTAWRNEAWERRTVIQFFGSADRTIEPEDEMQITAGWRFSSDSTNPNPHFRTVQEHMDNAAGAGKSKL